MAQLLLPGMKCPTCGFTETKVTNSRLAGQGLTVRRRRECGKCSFRFTTYEERELANFLVRKKDGSREPYKRLKLEGGIRKALEKRPVSEPKVQQMIALIEKEISVAGRGEIESVQIGKATLKHLALLDEVAYLRFASVYKAFKSPAGFLKEIEKLAHKN